MSPEPYGHRFLICCLAFLVSCCDIGGTQPIPPLQDCRPLARVEGPEDFAFDLVGERLLVSSQNRRNPDLQGGIYALPLPRGGATRLPLRDRGECSFHPHGIFLHEDDKGTRFLYVINHHDRSDATAQKACFPIESPVSGGLTSIEVFRVEEKALHFQRRLASPEFLTNANDLVIDKEGNVYVTVPPAGGLGLLAEKLDRPTWGGEKSRIVRYRAHVDADHCGGPWSIVATLGRFVNGIALLESTDEASKRLFVASTFDGYLHELESTAEGSAGECGEEWSHAASREVGIGLDNLMWADPGHSVILAAAHPDLRRFLQHFLSPRALSPSVIWRIPVRGVGGGNAFVGDGGGTISAASTAACHGSLLVLGQVFGDEVLQCEAEGFCVENTAAPSDGKAPPVEDSVETNAPGGKA